MDKHETIWMEIIDAIVLSVFHPANLLKFNIMPIKYHSAQQSNH